MRRAVPIVVVVAAVLGAAAPARAGRNVGTDEICSFQDQTPIVDLYSFGLGELVFEKFGHTMLCLTYPDTGVPTTCFNYGVTDFSDPELPWKFARAEARFWVDGEELPSMLAFYGSEDPDNFAVIPEGVEMFERHDRDGTVKRCLTRFNPDGSCDRPQYGEDRDIWRQRLSNHPDFTPEKARTIAARLCADGKGPPETRYYVYHHFFDNCTTRLRDMLDDVFEGGLRENSDGDYPITFREFGRRGLAEYTALIGISGFITGRNLDRHPTEWEAMFHPDVLRVSVETKLGVPTEVIYARRKPPIDTTPPEERPWIVMLSILFTAPLALTRWRGRFERLGVVIAVLPLFLLSLLIWAILVLIHIDWIRWNEALFLFLPTDAALFFLGEAKRRVYARVRVGMVAVISLLCVIGIFRQPLMIPLLTVFLPMSLMAFDLPPRRRKAEAEAAPVTSTTPAS